MTLQEFYSKIDESLDAVMNRLRKEDRIAKYNQLLRIEEQLGELSRYGF